MEGIIEAVEPAQAARHTQPQGEGKAGEGLVASSAARHAPLQPAHRCVMRRLPLPIVVLQIGQGFPACCTVRPSFHRQLQRLQQRGQSFRTLLLL